MQTQFLYEIYSEEREKKIVGKAMFVWFFPTHLRRFGNDHFEEAGSIRIFCFLSSSRDALSSRSVPSLIHEENNSCCLFNF